jgi:hypothetical protein
MRSRCRKVATVAGAALVGLGALWASSASAIEVIQNTSPVSIDGWNISWGTGVGLTVVQDAANSDQVDVEKTATFTAPNQGYQITFSPISGYDGTAATSFVIPDETIVNNTASSFNGFSFILMNTTSTLATFDSVARTFIPPTGPGYNYSSETLGPGSLQPFTILTYTGTQGSGVTSFWGNGDPSSTGDNLLIDAPAGSDFALKELSSSSSGGNVVPMPAAAWQSLAGLAGLGLIGLGRRLKQRRFT